MDYPTQQLPPQQPQSPPPGRARRTWVLPAVLGALLLTGGLAAATVIAGPNRDTDGIEVSEAANLDMLFEPGAAQPETDQPDADQPDAGEPEAGPPGAPDAGRPGADRPGAKDRPFRHGPKGHGPPRLREGEKVVAGAVSSTADGKLVVRKDDGAEVTVPTNGDTKVRGAENKALSDLQAGERVVVKVGSDGVADGVLAVKAHAAGTVTKLDGDRATVVRLGGLTTVLDLSGVSERPAVGTVVVAIGTATDDGATLKVEQIRELPTVN